MHSWSFRLNAIFTFTVSALGALSALNILSVRPLSRSMPPLAPAHGRPLPCPEARRPPCPPARHASAVPQLGVLHAQVAFLDPKPIASIDNVKLQRLPGSGSAPSLQIPPLPSCHTAAACKPRKRIGVPPPIVWCEQSGAPRRLLRILWMCMVSWWKSVFLSSGGCSLTPLGRRTGRTAPTRRRA